MTAGAGFRVGIDYGTSTTVGFLARPDGAVQQVLVEGWPVSPSAVYASTRAGLLVGRDALHAGRTDPAGLEPNPKQRIDEHAVWLGELHVPVVDLIGAVLGRMLREAVRVAGEPPATVTLTCPAGWGPRRRQVLVDAAAKAGAPGVHLVPEPVAAARFFAAATGARLPPGALALVYDLGAGTFDATVVRRTPAGFDVLASTGLPDTGGLDIDAALVAYLGGVYGARSPEAWRRLTEPASTEDRWASRQLWDDVRAAKERLSRTAAVQVDLPLLGVQAPVGREQLDLLARPILARTVAACRAVVGDAGADPARLSAVWLVGGATRMPLVASALHRALGIAPAALEQPELVVAQGSLLVEAPAATAPAGGGGLMAGTAPVRSPVASAPVRSPVAAPPVRRRATLGLAAAGIALLLVLGGIVAAELWSARDRSDDPHGSPSSSTVGGGGGADAPTIAQPIAVNRIATLLGHTDTVRAIAFSPDGRTLATAGDDETGRLWDVVNRQQRADVLLRHSDWIRAVAYSPDGRTLVTGGDDEVARTWDAATGKPLGQPLPGQAGSIDAVAFSRDGKTLAIGGSSRTVWRWDTTTGQPLGTPIEHGEMVTGLAFSPDGRILASSGCCASAQLWDAQTGARLHRLVGHAEQRTTNAISFDPTGTVVATASDDGTARLWTVATGRPRGEPITGHTNAVNAVAFSPDGSLLATASSDGTVRLWNPETGEPRSAPLAGHADDVTSLAFAPAGNLLASADATGTVVLWQIG